MHKKSNTEQLTKIKLVRKLLSGKLNSGNESAKPPGPTGEVGDPDASLAPVVLEAPASFASFRFR